MLQMMRRLFQGRRVTSREQEKAKLRAKLIAVAVARATHYADRAIEA